VRVDNVSKPVQAFIHTGIHVARAAQHAHSDDAILDPEFVQAVIKYANTEVLRGQIHPASGTLPLAGCGSLFKSVWLFDREVAVFDLGGEANHQELVLVVPIGAKFKLQSGNASIQDCIYGDVGILGAIMRA